MLSVRNLTKVYKLGKKGDSKNVVALNNVSIDFPDKGLVFLLGKSGSGKSTLLNAIGGLDTFDSGEIIIKGKSSKDFKQSDFDSYRNTFIGFIFQEYNILEEFSVGKNLALALELQGKKADKEAVDKLLKLVDLEGFYRRKPNQLSGGQKQRVAIARALIKNPEIIMADEPTGALDSNTGKQVMDTLKKLSKSKLVIIVSHDREFAHLYGDRVVELKDGVIINDDTKKEIEAVKSESGISFIDDKIVHIKKGQKVAKADYEKIIKLIAENSKNGETIISFDNKTNSEVKKTAFITDEGNQQVFMNTKKSDIIQKPHDPDDLELIRSRLKVKDAFKMGASSLKHKPIRLIFTILLACIAFTLFGVVDTMSSFNRASSVYESVKNLNLNSIAVASYVGTGYDSEINIIKEEDLQKLKEKYSSYEIQPVIFKDRDFYFDGNRANSSSSKLDEFFVSGIMPIDEQIATNLHLLNNGNLIQGRYPTAITTSDNFREKIMEIGVSKHVYELIKENSNLTFEEISQKYFRIYDRTGDLYFKIVGVFDNDVDMKKYNNQHGSNQNFINSYLMENELRTATVYSHFNMTYVHPSIFNSLSSSYNSDDNDLFYTYDDNYGNYINNVYTYSRYVKEYSSRDITVKSGTYAAHLEDNQIILSKDLCSSYLNITMEDIEKGYTFKCGRNYSLADEYEFEVIGMFDGGSSDVMISDGKYKEIFAGYDFFVTRLKGNSGDRKFISGLENYSKNKISYHLQFGSTSTLDSFDSTLASMKQPLFWVGFGFAVFAGLMLMNFIATSISYKKREIGILRAIGARGKDVFSIFFWESFVICIINFVLSCIATSVCCFFINRAILNELGFTITLLTFGIRQIVLLFGVSFLVAFVSSFLPVNRIAHKNPIDSINNR